MSWLGLGRCRSAQMGRPALAAFCKTTGAADATQLGIHLGHQWEPIGISFGAFWDPLWIRKGSALDPLFHPPPILNPLLNNNLCPPQEPRNDCFSTPHRLPSAAGGPFVSEHHRLQ